MKELKVPVDSNPPGHFDQLFRCCSNPSESSQLKKGRRTFELFSELDDIWERHTRCKIETDGLQDESFNSQQPLSIVFHNLSSHESSNVQLLYK
jgi:hypothetical protein